MIDILSYIFGGNITEFIANTSWYIAIAILIYGFLQKDDIRSIKIISLSTIFWAINYALLWLYWALIATAIAALRMYFSLKYKWKIWAISTILILNIVFWFFVYTWIVSVLPIIAGIISVLAYQIYSWITMRLYLVSFSLTWMTYMIIVWNIPGIINEIITISVLCFTIYKMSIGDLDKMTYKQKLLLIIKRVKSRAAVDFGRFGVLRDVKRYFNKDVLVDYKKKKTLGS